MKRITLTHSERVQFVQMAGSDFCIASLLAALVISRQNNDGYRDTQALLARQNVGFRLEALHRVEISRSKMSKIAFSPESFDGENAIEMDDVYTCGDGMTILRDLIGAIQLRDEFAKFFDAYGFEPAIELNVEDIPGVNFDHLTLLLRGVVSLTGIGIDITGLPA